MYFTNHLFAVHLTLFMPAAYDSYDYPSYWKDRVYEHKAETIAIKSLLSKIKNIHTLIDIGAGFGRLKPLYLYRAKKVILVDPSARLLKIARKEESRKVTFLQSTIAKLPSKLQRTKADVILLVRVVHHLEHIDEALIALEKICKNGGYLILEYPNKRHLKATLQELWHGNFTYLLDIFPKDRRSQKSIRKNVLPFVNYHPDYVTGKLEEYSFKIISSISVSYFRSYFMKRFIPLDVLLSLEKFFQTYLSKLYLAPSVFVLAKKIDR